MTRILRKVTSSLAIKKFGKAMDQYKSGLAYIDVKGNCNPFDLFKEWLEEAKQYGKFKAPIFNLATSSKSGNVSNRTVVLRDLKNQSFIFTTNGNSRKIQQMKDNPKVSGCFFWGYQKDEKFIHKQIRIEGIAEKLSNEECEEYHNKDPLFCQIRSHICQQGQKVDWDELKKKHDEILEAVKETNKPLKMPEYYVAYRIIPNMFDFYYSYNTNIADRLAFTKQCEDKWTFERIAA